MGILTRNGLKQRENLSNIYWRCSSFFNFDFELVFIYPVGLTIECKVSQNGQTHFKNVSVNAARFLRCVWPFEGIKHRLFKLTLGILSFR